MRPTEDMKQRAVAALDAHWNAVNNTTTPEDIARIALAGALDGYDSPPFILTPNERALAKIGEGQSSSPGATTESWVAVELAKIVRRAESVLASKQAEQTGEWTEADYEAATKALLEARRHGDQTERLAAETLHAVAYRLAPAAPVKPEVPGAVLAELIIAIDHWAAQEDGVPDEVFPSYMAVRTHLGWADDTGEHNARAIAAASVPAQTIVEARAQSHNTLESELCQARCQVAELEAQISAQPSVEPLSEERREDAEAIVRCWPERSAERNVAEELLRRFPKPAPKPKTIGQLAFEAHLRAGNWDGLADFAKASWEKTAAAVIAAHEASK